MKKVDIFKVIIISVLLSFPLYSPSYVMAQTSSGTESSVAQEVPSEGVSVKETMQLALDTFPELKGKVHAYKGSLHSFKGAHAGYRPKLDLYYGVGRYNLDGDGYKYTLYNMYNHSYDGLSATLTQPIYDGGETRSQVRYNRANKNMRYFDMLSVMENVGYASFRAHHDVIRYRELVALAENNLRRHEELVEKVKRRTESGVDSPINLRTAMGRLSLARTNLITQQSNLHDAVTQYIRITGVQPADNLLIYEDDTFALPESSEAALKSVFSGNYRLMSYSENIKAMKNLVGVNATKMRPKADFRAGANLNNDQEGTAGRKDKGYIELAIRWNLYNGNFDRENLLKAAEQYEEAKELYEKVERDVVQSVLISYNDVKSIEKQMPYMKSHRDSSRKTADAYQKQFEAGRRSLFDLLDIENEYFQASMAYTNARFNKKNAAANYIVSLGKFTKYFGIKGAEIPEPEKAGINMDEIIKELTEKQPEQK